MQCLAHEMIHKSNRFTISDQNPSYCLLPTRGSSRNAKMERRGVTQQHARNLLVLTRSPTFVTLFVLYPSLSYGQQDMLKANSEKDCDVLIVGAGTFPLMLACAPTNTCL